jgi:F-type H+-transporting ATPase subunit delta
MAAFQSQSMVMADVYAEAALAAASERGQAEDLAAEFADLVQYLGRDPDFNTFLTSRSIDDDVRRESLEKLFRGRMNDLVLNVLQVLNRRGRGELVRAVARCVQLRLQALRRQREVSVQTAVPLTDELRAAIKKDVSERIGAEALLIEEIQPDLIGGVIIRIGDEQIDACVASQIRAMRNRLIERGMEEIRGGRGYEVET